MHCSIYKGGPLHVQSGSISLLSGLITDHRVFKFRDPSSFAGSKYLLKIKLSQHSSGDKLYLVKRNTDMEYFCSESFTDMEKRKIFFEYTRI